MSVNQEVRITLRLSDSMLGWVLEQAALRKIKPAAMWRMCLAMGRERLETGTNCADPIHTVKLAELGRWRSMAAQCETPFELPKDLTGWEFVIVKIPPEPAAQDLTVFDDQPKPMPEGAVRINPNQYRTVKGVVVWDGPIDADQNPLYEESA